MKQLTIEHLAAYAAHGVQTQSGHYLVGVYTGTSDITRPMLLSETKNGPIDWEANLNMDKLLLRPLSQLTEVIEHNGERFVPIDLFEIGDGENDSIEYDFGNIKLIKTLELIAKHTTLQDCDFLPNGVVKNLHSWHFDTFGLIEAGLAEPIKSIEQ